MHQGTTLLLGLDGLAVDRVELASDGTRVVHVVTATQIATVCPSCGTPSAARKQRVVTCPQDLPYGEHAIRVVWHKNRWHCHQPDCPRKTFTESAPQVPPRKRVTERLRAAAGGAVADAGRTVIQAARDLGLSWPVVHAAFVTHATAMLSEEPEPVVALGIDETRRGTPRFALDPETGVVEQVVDRWHTGFVDLSGDQGLVGQVEGRSAGDAGSWLAARTPRWRESVAVVALTPEKFSDMWNRLIEMGAAGEQILAAWIAKEELRALLTLARTHPTRHRISQLLWAFYRWCADTDIAELHRLARTIQAWWPQIEAFIHTGVTNAASEGINRLIKLEARNAFGFRNPINQRLRSRCASVRAARRPAKPG